MVKQLDDVKILPTLPHILLRLMEVCDRDDAQFSDVASLVEKDPSLSAKVLGLVNSPLYGLPNRVSTVSHAVKLLGMDTVKNIAICASVHEVFSRGRSARSLNLAGFWSHSLTVAVLSRKLAQEVDYPSPEEAFLSGLLHNIGRLILAEIYPEEYSLLLAYEEYGNGLEEKEEALGMTHMEAGAYLISHWNLPSLIADAVRYHHEHPELVRTSFPLVQIVNTACMLARAGDREPLTCRFDIKASRVETMRNESRGEVVAVAKALAIPIGDFPSEAENQSLGEAFENLEGTVKSVSLLLGTLERIMTREDEDSVYVSLMEGMNIVFGISDSLCFRYDKDRSLLKAVHFRGSPESLESLSVSVADGKSLPAASLAGGKILSSFETETPSILDRQLLSLSGKEGFFCVPLIFRGERFGMLVCFLSKVQAPGFIKERSGVELLSREAAHVLFSESVRKARAALLLSERMEAQTLMARKIVHEANNPLSIMRNYLKMLESKLKDSEFDAASFTVIHEELDRISKLLRGFVDFSFPRSVPPEPTDLLKTLRDTLRFIQGGYAHKGITVEVEDDKTIPVLTLRRDSLKQIIVNVLKNAFEAVPQGGWIRITTSLASRWVEIAFWNNGTPIPLDIRDRIFEPLVSTKGKGHEGLGLSIVYNLAREMGGSVRFEDSPSKDTCFVLQLPL
jgi:HD-like signal output (HDOD) protein/signal transduction histidine kinase